VTLNQITITPYIDTDNTTDTGGTNGSRMTNTGGRGMYEAATDARNQVLTFAAQKFNADAKAKTPPDPTVVTAADLDLIDGKVFVKADTKRTSVFRMSSPSRPRPSWACPTTSSRPPLSRWPSER